MNTVIMSVNIDFGTEHTDIIHFEQSRSLISLTHQMSDISQPANKITENLLVQKIHVNEKRENSEFKIG